MTNVMGERLHWVLAGGFGSGNSRGVVAVTSEHIPAPGVPVAKRVGARWAAVRWPGRDVADIAAGGTVLAALALGALTLLATVTAGSAPPVTATAVLLTACLAIYSRHLVFAVRDTIPRAAHLSAVLLGVLVLGGAPVLGAAWLSSLHIVAVVVTLTLRPWYAIPVALVLVAAVAPLAVLLGAPERDAIWLLVTTGMRVVAVYSLVWMVVALRRLRSASTALAEQAVARERLRIDRDVSRSVQSALVTIGESARRAADLITANDHETARGELEDLVGTSRRGLAEARLLIRSFQAPDLRREIASTAALLAAAGIEAHVDVPTAGPPAHEIPRLRAELRDLLTALLREMPAHPVHIAVRWEDRRWVLACTAVPVRAAPVPGPGPAG